MSQFIFDNNINKKNFYKKILFFSTVIKFVDTNRSLKENRLFVNRFILSGLAKLLISQLKFRQYIIMRKKKFFYIPYG